MSKWRFWLSALATTVPHDRSTSPQQATLIPFTWCWSQGNQEHKERARTNVQELLSLSLQQMYSLPMVKAIIWQMMQCRRALFQRMDTKRGGQIVGHSCNNPPHWEHRNCIRDVGYYCFYNSSHGIIKTAWSCSPENLAPVQSWYFHKWYHHGWMNRWAHSLHKSWLCDLLSHGDRTKP